MSDLHEQMRRAIEAQGKFDPDAVFAEAEHVDLDEWAKPSLWDERDLDDDPGPDPDLRELDPQGQLDVEEPRGYGYEP